RSVFWTMPGHQSVETFTNILVCECKLHSSLRGQWTQVNIETTLPASVQTETEECQLAVFQSICKWQSHKPEMIGNRICCLNSFNGRVVEAVLTAAHIQFDISPLPCRNVNSCVEHDACKFDPTPTYRERQELCEG